MKLVLTRIQLEDDCTIGSLSVNGTFECWTLEDKVRSAGVKVPGKTAIPYGEYGVDITYSPHFDQFMPLLLSVHGFEGVRIHPGNTAADTDGCILVGLERGAASIGRSRDAYHALLPKMQQALDAGETIVLEITRPIALEAIA